MLNALKNSEAVIFDMDGTLIDSMYVWPKLDVEFLSRFGIEYEDSLQKEIAGLSIAETADYFIDHYHLNFTPQELMDMWNEMAFHEYAYEVPYKNGALDFLKHLKKLGKKTGIATSNSRELVEAVDSRLSFSEYIDVIVTSKEVPNGKPKPDIYLKVAEHLNVSPDKCFVFEDIPEGIMAGNAAGMTTCAIEDNFSKKLREEKISLANYFIEDYEELL